MHHQEFTQINNVPKVRSPTCPSPILKDGLTGTYIQNEQARVSIKKLLTLCALHPVWYPLLVH